MGDKMCGPHKDRFPDTSVEATLVAQSKFTCDNLYVERKSRVVCE